MSDFANLPPELREAIEQFDCVTMHGEKWKLIRTALLNAFEPSGGHVWWGAGEKDCPRDIKASNGELHTLRCKKCGGDWRSVCTSA